MFKVYFNSIRLAVALVCVGVSLILAGQWLGFVPDARLCELEGRKRQCEAIAISSATMVRSENWPQLEAALTAITERDENLLSIGVRTNSGYLRLHTDGHAEHWKAAADAVLPTAEPEIETARELASALDPRSSTADDAIAYDTMQVPITVNRQQWGRVELCYHALSPPGFYSLLSHPLIRLISFFTIAGLGAYALFAARLFGVFDGAQVVPDRVRQALDTLAEGLLVLDENEQIVLANKAFTETTQADQATLQGSRASTLPWVEDDQCDPQEYPWVRAIAEGTPQTEILLRYALPDGKERIFSTNSAPIVASDGSQRGTLATFRDVTHVEEQRLRMQQMLTVLQSSRDEIKQKNKELEILATQDPLTGCLNRRAFFEGIAGHWAAAQQTHQPLACIMLDNDHFKSVNDTYGHHTGDEVLRAVAAILRSVKGEKDLICRYGGEEFCIMLPGRDAKQAERYAEQIRGRIETIRILSSPDLRITASFGVADLTYQPHDPQELINQADSCLYVAKRQGRNRVIVYLPQFALMQDDATTNEEPLDEEVDQSVAVPFQAVMALVSALAFRDSETAEHSRRVADLVVTAAKGLLEQREIYLLEIAALLHDIGKIGVPDNVLLKPGKLTAEEWKLMNKHDRIGVEIVAGTFNCDTLSETIRTHHAFYGGKPQPSTLPTGEDIPIAARILAICDSYDAIVSDRPYRKGRSHDAAVAELRRCSGTQYDPELVEHFISAVEAKRKIGGAACLAVPKQTALQIGLQLERLAEALDDRDADGLNALASRVAKVARHCGVNEIAVMAEKLELQSASDDSDWMLLLGTTVELLDLCRSTQNVFLSGAKIR